MCYYCGKKNIVKDWTKKESAYCTICRNLDQKVQNKIRANLNKTEVPQDKIYKQRKI